MWNIVERESKLFDPVMKVAFRLFIKQLFSESGVLCLEAIDFSFGQLSVDMPLHSLHGYLGAFCMPEAMKQLCRKRLLNDSYYSIKTMQSSLHEI